jgi:hypothetical protein
MRLQTRLVRPVLSASIVSPERLATRTFLPSAKNLEADARRLAVLGIGNGEVRQVDRRFLGDDAALRVCWVWRW